MKNKTARNSRPTTETCSTIRLVALPNAEQLEAAVAVIAQSRLARIAQLEEQIEQEVCALVTLGRDSAPLRNALRGFDKPQNALAAARQAAQTEIGGAK